MGRIRPDSLDPDRADSFVAVDVLVREEPHDEEEEEDDHKEEDDEDKEDDEGYLE